MRKLTILMILVATAAVALPQGMQMPMTKTAGPQSDAQKAFEKLKTLTVRGCRQALIDRDAHAEL